MSEPNRGINLYRCYLMDIVTDPLAPAIAIVYKRGDGYPETQSLVRGILNKKDGTAGEQLFLDEACEQSAEFPEQWTLTLLSKVRETTVTKRGGLDREWVRLTMERSDLSAEEKLALIAKHT